MPASVAEANAQDRVSHRTKRFAKREARTAGRYISFRSKSIARAEMFDPQHSVLFPPVPSPYLDARPLDWWHDIIL